MATADLHAQIMAYDYFADREVQPGGLAVLASLVRRLRMGSPNAFLLDNGDFLQGNALADWAATRDARGPNPVVAAMNALGYDAGTLGNHEFNYGLPYLQRAMAELDFPLVSANLVHGSGAAKGRPIVQPWLILPRMIRDIAGRPWPVRLGVIGFAPPQTGQWDRLILAGAVTARDIVETARTEVPALRAAGAEIVVALCHSGIGSAEAIHGMENAALALAAVEGIDALVMGHTHGVFPAAGLPGVAGVDPVRGTLCGKPAVMAGSLGSHLGLIDLRIARRDGTWEVIGHDVRAVPADAMPVRPDLAVMAVARPTHDRTLERIRSPIGRIDHEIDSHFALVTTDASLRIVAEAQAARTRQVQQGTPWESLPVLSAVAPFRTGGRGGPDSYIEIPAGPIMVRHACELYIYPNTLHVVEARGAVLADWLERSAGLFLPVTPWQVDQPLIDPSFPSYNFDVILGLTWQIDPSRPLGERVSDIRWQGRPLDPQQRFAVATNSYRLGGAGVFAGLLDDAPMLHADRTQVRDLVIDHLRTPPAAGVFGGGATWREVWRFAGLAGTSAWFETAPRARSPRGDLDLTDLGLDDDGFRRFSLRFQGRGRQADRRRA